MNTVTAISQPTMLRTTALHSCGVKCSHNAQTVNTVRQPTFLTGMTVEELSTNKLSLGKRLGLGLIAAYQWTTRKISPNGTIQNKFFTCNCNPSCSVYTAESIKQHGLFKGSYMGLKQIMSQCYPFAPIMKQYGFRQGIPMVFKAIAFEMGLMLTNEGYKEAYQNVQSCLGNIESKKLSLKTGTIL